MTHIELELYRVRKRRRILFSSITIIAFILSFTLLSWTNSLVLTSFIAIVAWGVLSAPVEQLEDLRTIRRG